MRKLLLTLLLAGAVATPALAEPGDQADRPDRAERQAERAERQAARAERQEMRSERTHFDGSSPPAQFQHNAPTVQVQPNVQPNTQSDMAGMGEIRPGHGDANGDEGVRNFRTQHRGQGSVGARAGIEPGTLRQSDRELPTIMQPRHRSLMVSDTPREGTQPPLRAENRLRSQQPQWSTNWRSDHRYDWRDWRHRHRSLFHFGFYYDPFGWGYRPYSIGWRLWPSYYGSNYWISDPWQYRLPYASAGYRWIRYYDDAVLVDTWNGQVVDVIYNFFW